MSSSTTCRAITHNAQDVTDLAGVLGASLLANLKDPLREVVATEAKLWRADALSILRKLRTEDQCSFADSESEDGRGSLRFQRATILPGETTRSGSHSSMWRRTTSVEQRFTADVFTAKFGRSTSLEPFVPFDFASSLESKVHNDSIGASSLGTPQVVRSTSPEFTARRRKGKSLEPIIPSEPASSSRPHSQLEFEDCNRFHQSACGYCDQCFASAGQGASSRTTVVRSSSQASCLESLPSTIGRIPSGKSEDPLAPARDTSGAGERFQRRVSETTCDFQVSMNRERSVTRWRDEAELFFYNRSTTVDESKRTVRSLMSTVFCALGIIPWNEQRFMLSSLYQFGCLCWLIVSTLGIVTKSFVDLSFSEEDNEAVAYYVGDVLAVAALLSFIAALWKSKALRDTTWLIESYLSRAGHLDEVNKQSYLDILVIVFIWSASLGSRLYVNGMVLSLSDFCFALNVLVLLAICFCASRICRCLFYMVELFCGFMQDNSDFEKALQEFFLLHCTIRTVCASLQLCFAMLQLTATVLFLFCSASIYIQRMSLEIIAVQLIPGMLCIMVLLQLAIRAGRVTDQCARVPMLVNSFNAKLDIRRMCVVDYIVYSQVGFYLFEVRLSTAAVFKLSYVAFVAWCGVLTQGMI